MRPRTTSTLILALAAGLAAGCGSDDEQDGAPIPAERAAALERQLDSIQARLEFGGDACADISGNADPNTTAVRSVIDSLPENVDPDVRDALEQSFDRLFELTEEQCDEEKGQETEAEPPPLETETTETLPPEEEEDDEEEEEPPPPEEVPTEEVPPEVPPGEGQGGGGGSGAEGGSPGQGGGGGALVPGEGG